MSPMDSLTLHTILWWAATVPPVLILGTAAARACRKRRDRRQRAHPDGCNCGPCREWAAVLSVIEGTGGQL